MMSSEVIDIATTTLLSPAEICARLRVSRSTFDRWRKSDSKLTPFPEPSLRLGSKIQRWTTRVVDDWVFENTAAF